LSLVLILGKTALGAQRWLNIGGFSLQPSEFTKIVFIIVMASYLGRVRLRITEPASVFGALVITGVPFALILVQPDLGTALMLIPILFAMLFAAGTMKRYLIVIASSGILALPVFWHFLKAYQQKRLLVFINPDIDPLGAGYTIIQSKIAIGSGGIFGKGWLSGTQNLLNFLPERHTDFMFSVVGEEWGFIGGFIVIALYIALIKRGFSIAEETTEIHGKLMAVGITTMLAFQVIVNVSMTLGLMPVVGLPLPLMSYGGSSLWTTMTCIGLLLNVKMRQTRF
ncbi:MAG: rod shape-determining protein RodA, partial [Candidatus Omnitrophota bacterium]